MMSKFVDMSTSQILGKLGERYKDYRLASMLTQAEAAAKAGISVQTLRAFETGRACGITLSSLVGLLRAVGLMDGLDGLIPDMPVSPYLISEIEGRKKKRVKHSNNGIGYGRKD